MSEVGSVLYRGSRDELNEMCRVKDARIAELGDVLVLVESFLDGWHMPDDECQKEADSLLAVVREAMQKIEQ